MIDKASKLLQKEWQTYELRMLDRAHGRSKSPGAEWRRPSTKAPTSSTSASSKRDRDPMPSASRLGVSEVVALDAADEPFPSIENDASFNFGQMPKKSKGNSHSHIQNRAYHQWSDLPENIRLCIMKLMSEHVGAIWEAQRLLMLDFIEIQDFENLYIRERSKCLAYTEAVMKGLKSKEALVETLRRAGREASADIELLRPEKFEQEYGLVVEKVTSQDVIAGKSFLQKIGLPDFGAMLERFEGVATGPMFEIEFQLSGEVGIQPFLFELDWNMTAEEGLICSRANIEARQQPISHGWMHLQRDQDELNPNVNPVHLHYPRPSLKKTMSGGKDFEGRRQDNRPREPVGGNLQQELQKNQPGVSPFSRLTPVSNSSSDDLSKEATLKRSDKREGVVTHHSALTRDRGDDDEVDAVRKPRGYTDGALNPPDKMNKDTPITITTAPPASMQHPTTPTKIVLKTSVGLGKRGAPEELSSPQKKARITQERGVKQSRSAGIYTQDQQRKNQNQPNAAVGAARLKRTAGPVSNQSIQRELQA
ncbi:hypothetical protein PspLS_02715 [Pyricularia sp. CBS 133598]|nr:hypothetical protein PspLS_02715 [Pyricularia sp. CBS 133598]